MIIHINPDWRIESDPLQWIIQKRRVVIGDVRPSYRPYHQPLDNAVMNATIKTCGEAFGFLTSQGSFNSLADCEEHRPSVGVRHE
jgi:hypothetical protein